MSEPHHELLRQAHDDDLGAGVLMPHDLSPADLADFGRLVEALGYDMLWIPENSFLSGGIAAAGVVLSATGALRVGLGVLPAPTRHPATMAMDISTLANAHPRRLVAGIGLGVPAWVRRMGLLPDKPARFMKDYLAALRQLLDGAETTAEIYGSAYRLDAIALAQPPLSEVPLAIGAVGELMLKLAGRAADMTLISTLASPQYVAWAHGVVREAADAAGRAAPRSVCFVSTSVHEDLDEARQLIRPDFAFVLRAMGVCALTTQLGIDRDLGQLLQGDVPLAEAMPDEWVDQMAIVGTQDDLVERVAAYRLSGADDLVFSPKPAARTIEVLTSVSDALSLRERVPR